MPFLGFFVENCLVVLVNLVLVVPLLLALRIVRERPDFVLEGQLDARALLRGTLQLAKVFPECLRELRLLLFQVVSLFLDNFELGVEHELLSFDLQGLLLQLGDGLVEVAVHLGILRLEQADVLMRSLFVVKETANARFLLIFGHFLSQDLEFKLHKVNLLLQVHNVLVSGIHVGVVPQLPRRELLLVLAPKVHLHCGLVVLAVSERSEVSATFQTSAGACHKQSKY